LGVAAQHTGTVVTGGVGSGTVDGKLLDFLVADEVEVGVGGEGIAEVLVLDEYLGVFGVFNVPHERPGFLEETFDVEVTFLLSFVRFDLET